MLYKEFSLICRYYAYKDGIVFQRIEFEIQCLFILLYYWDLSGSGAVMTDRLTAGREDYMSIAGLGTYSSSGYYYKAVTKSRSGSLSNVSDDYLSKEIPKDDPMHDFKEAVGRRLHLRLIVNVLLRILRQRHFMHRKMILVK